jgi:hypothetical protein
MKKSGLNTIIAGHFTKGPLRHRSANSIKLMIIEPGQTYLLDGKTEVKVIKPINRSHTMYSIEIPGHSIESVEKTRLVPVQPAIPSVEKR